MLAYEREVTRAILDTVGALIVVIDPDARVVAFNKSAEEASGYTADDMIGTKAWLTLIPEGERLSTEAAFASLVAGHFPNSNENDWVARSGVRRRILWRNTAVVGEDGSVRYVIGTGIDVTHMRCLEDELRRQALVDALTGLPNRTAFVEALEGLTARAASSAAVLFLDLDDFKDVNDTLGHPAGDRLLEVIGGRLRACVRSGDLVARFGGDEFTVLLFDADLEVARGIASRIESALARPVRMGRRSIYPRASIGIALTEPDTSVTDIIANADVAMYAAKSRGKGAIIPFSPDLRRRAWGRLERATAAS